MQSTDPGSKFIFLSSQTYSPDEDTTHAPDVTTLVTNNRNESKTNQTEGGEQFEAVQNLQGIGEKVRSIAIVITVLMIAILMVLMVVGLSCKVVRSRRITRGRGEDMEPIAMSAGYPAEYSL